MVKVNVSEDGAGLRIKIDQLGTKQAKVLEALQECSEGRCTCPTSQYEKLESVEIAPADDGINIALKPKSGETIDRQAIDKCLEYTARSAEKK